MRASLGLMLVAGASILAMPAKANADDWRRGVFGGSWMDTNVASASKSSGASRRASTQSSSKSSDDESKPTRTASSGSSGSRSASGYSGGGGGESGMASYYWQPQRVASGGWFNPNAMTAAHKTLPFGTKVRVTNRHNGQSVVVTINDRGPFVAGRVIDLSSAAAGVIGMKGAGVVPVSIARLD